MEKLSFLVFVCFLHYGAAYYTLTEEQFASMPPLVHLDRYTHCVGKPGGVYCTSNAVIMTDHQNDIYDMMVNYTAHASRHYNYTNILYGLCITDRCKKYYKGNSPPELLRAAEACLNDTLSQRYDLKAKVTDINCYKHKDDRHKIDYLDRTAANCCFTLLSLVFLATVYDLAMGKKGEEGVLLSFSLRGNWDRLMKPPSSHSRKSLLAALNGIRFLTSILVMLGHVPIPPFSFPENPVWLEHALQNVFLQSMFQGHVITLTFFTMSGFLLTYNSQILRETRVMDWVMLPKGILIRWLRLAPVNIAMLVFTATWFRFTDLGPFYQETIGVESKDCRRFWIAHVLYYNNYIDDSACNIQNWSMAVDMHLHIVGMIIIILSPSVKFRNRALLALFLVGLIIPPIVTFAKDLDATFLVTAENIRQYFLKDETFNNSYKRTHTNVPCFVMGLALGYQVYDWHTGIKQVPPKLKEFLRYTSWLLVPMMALVSSCTFLFFLGDGPRRPMYQRMLYATLQKPIFGAVIALIIIGAVIRAEKIVIYRRILEWPVWAYLSKLTYCMFAVHVTVLRYLYGSKATLSYLSFPHIFQEYSGIVFISMIFGFALYMLVEAPFGQLVKVLLLNNFVTKHKPINNMKVIQSNGKAIYSNGNSFYSNGNSLYSNGDIHNGTITALSNGSAVYANGKPNGVYNNGKSLKSE